METSRSIRRAGVAFLIAVFPPGCGGLGNLIRAERCKVPGGVLSSWVPGPLRFWDGVAFLSLEHGRKTKLLRQEELAPDLIKLRRTGARYAAPVYDERTSTLYFVDHKLGAIVRWHSGSLEPSILCPMPSGYDATCTCWLLLNPTGSELYFTWSKEWPIYGDIVGCDIATGRTHVVCTAVLYHQRPEWLDQDHLLVSALQPRHRGNDFYQIQKVNVRTGARAPLMSSMPSSKVFCVSPSRRRLFAFASDNVCRLYDLQALQLIKELPPGVVRYADDPAAIAEQGSEWSMCLADDVHLVCTRRVPIPRLLQGGLMGKYCSAGMAIVDLDTLKQRKLTASHAHPSIHYLRSCPKWQPGPTRPKVPAAKQ